jgi:hypothetical protein
MYFFASYWAYNYFDGLGIRVLVDYYALFSFIGAKFFTHLLAKTLVFKSVVFLAGLLVFMNLIYCYQANRNILLRAGMTYTKWKYIFLRTGESYQNVLGGSHELTPYSAEKQEAVFQKEIKLEQPFDYTQKDYGLVLAFDSLGFHSNRIHLKIKCRRKELILRASDEAMICAVLEDRATKQTKSYTQFKLNEAPATSCCDAREYNYTTNISADFKPHDKLSVFLWNREKQPFLVDKFSVEVYNYGFQIN